MFGEDDYFNQKRYEAIGEVSLYIILYDKGKYCLNKSQYLFMC